MHGPAQVGGVINVQRVTLCEPPQEWWTPRERCKLHLRRSITASRRRNNTREFKVEAGKLVTEKGYSVAEAARSLGIGETLLRSWKQAREEQGEQAFPGKGNLPAIEEEVRQLRAENKRLQMER